MEAKTQYITKDMTMGEIMEKYPFTAEVMSSYGLHCVGCSVNPYESLENGAAGHGMDDEEMESMLQELNDLVASNKDEIKQEKHVDITGAKVTVTSFAASKVKELMKSNNIEGKGLRIAVTRGGCSGKTYQMDFDEAKPDDIVFEEHGLKVIVDPKSMEFLNGTNVDYVESLNGAGFKLENPNVSGGCGCGKSVH